MSDDLIKRLRSQKAVDGRPHEIEQLTDEAAAMIEQQAALILSLESRTAQQARTIAAMCQQVADLKPAVAPAVDAQPVVGWQPIETAPKDGCMFLGWVDAVRYGESDEGAQSEVNVSEHDFCRWNERDGYVENMMGQIGDAYHVTHWMPLPEAPAALSQKDPQ